MSPRWTWNGGSDDKESACSVEDPALIPGSWRSSGKVNGYLLQYSSLENSMDRVSWWATVHGSHRFRYECVTNTFTLSQSSKNRNVATWGFYVKKARVTHSSTLAWRILGTGEPGGLSSMGSHRVGQDWSDLAAAAAEAFMQWEVFQ